MVSRCRTPPVAVPPHAARYNLVSGERRDAIEFARPPTPGPASASDHPPHLSQLCPAPALPCVVPGLVLLPVCNAGYTQVRVLFLPVKCLSRCFAANCRGAAQSYLAASGSRRRHRRPRDRPRHAFMDTLFAPLGPLSTALADRQLDRYLGRYPHLVAISNPGAGLRRERFTFRWKTTAMRSWRTMTGRRGFPTLVRFPAARVCPHSAVWLSRQCLSTASWPSPAPTRPAPAPPIARPRDHATPPGMPASAPRTSALSSPPSALGGGRSLYVHDRHTSGDPHFP